jgi:hypothetical protein
MRLAGALALVAATVLAGCTSAPAASSPPSSTPSLSPAASSIPSALSAAPASPSPTDQPTATTVNCTHPYNSTHGVALVSYAGAIGVLDVSNGLKPFLLCWFSPAQGAAFDQAAKQVVFWAGNHLGAIDLAAGKVTMTDTLPATPWEGVFSHDGSLFAYRTGDDTTGMSTHVYHGGVDRVLYTEAGLGGHGGPSWGPLDRLEFSADDQYLLDFYEFRPASGPDRLLIYQTGAILVSSVPPDSLRRLSVNQAEPGAWSTKGSALFYYVPPTGSTPGKVLWWEPSGVLELASGIGSWSWPVVQPQGSELYYNEWVSTVPNDQCGGLPHLWRIDLGDGKPSQASDAVASHPVFVTPSFVWMNEEKLTGCGIGGESAPDGVILGYDLANGSTKQVDMSLAVPGVGAPQSNSGSVVDVWL